MRTLYVTADRINETSGGGVVTFNEAEALKSLGNCDVYGREQLECEGQEPWKWDIKTLDGIWKSLELAACRVSGTWIGEGLSEYPKLAHFYAGTFSETVAVLKNHGCKITYTAAAHDVDVSRREHEVYGIPYNYPHLNDPELWKRYLQGYKDADVLICPSTHSANVMRRFGCTNKIEIIPHGVNLPVEVKPLPSRFVCGYLGSCGAPDKGVIYLLQAWKKLAYKDGSVLVLAGRDSTSPFVRGLVERYGGGSIVLAGWQKDVGEFYNSLSLYIQPSSSEGFGIEVLEAQAHGRPVICSDGAGAADVVTPECGYAFTPPQWWVLSAIIDEFKTGKESLEKFGIAGREEAAKYTWDIIRSRYVALWKELLQ